jgi:lysophospholipase L1-like esterase
MNASMATDGFVVLAEKFYPGWRAYVDGRQVPVYKANYTFQAIAVPQGEHEILFSFQPTDFILGFVITMATCIGLLAYASVQRAHPAWLATKGESLRAFLAGRCHPKIRSILINVLLMLISLTVAATLLEIYMRQSPHFRHGGDRAPRNDENLTWEKPEGTKRVVVLGDSLTFGDGVRAPETYPAQLQNLLRTRQDGAFQVINLGIMGINTDHEALILLRENPYFGRPAMDFEPDLLVLTFCVNDLELMADPKPRPETKLLPGALEQYLRSHYKLYQFVHKRANQLLASLGVQPSYIEYLQQLYRSDTQEWQDLISYIDLIATATQEHSIPLLLVIFPSLNTLDASHPFLDLYASIREQGEQRGIEVLDLFPYFQGQDAAKLRVSLMNGHPNAEAYSIAAEAIYTTITEKGLL